MKTIGYISSTIILLVYGTTINGWALAKLWSWFMESTFGLPAISIPAAIGLSLVVSYLTHQTGKSEPGKEYWEVLVEGTVAATLKPVFALLFGAVVRMWL